MPEFDDENTPRSLRPLHTLDLAGRAGARPLPPEEVRRRGARRHRRRAVGSVAVLAAVVAVVVGGVAVTADNVSGTSPRPAPASGPEPSMDRSVLLRADQIVYQEAGDFRVSETLHGQGEGPVSVCQRDPLVFLGAADIWRRDFTFRRGGDAVVRTAALQFADGGAAAAAYRTVRRWVDDCAGAARSRGFTEVFPKGRWLDVDAGEAVAEFHDGMTYGPVPGDRFGELRYFDDEGLVRSGDRIMLVSLVIPGQDWNWAYDERTARQVGLTMNPMFGTLAQAADNLRR